MTLDTIAKCLETATGTKFSPVVPAKFRDLLKAEGVAIVPAEPTEGMVVAGEKVMPPAFGCDLPDDCPRVYRAMIAALQEDGE